MIPTSIDGTDITGATIDGTEVQEITVDGDTVFSATDVLEDFERSNPINDYSGDTGQYSTTSSNVFNGSTALEGTSGGADEFISSTSVATVSQGETLNCRIRIDTNTIAAFQFGVQTAGNLDTYQVSVDARSGKDDMNIVHWDNGSYNKIGSVGSVGIPQDEYLRAEVTWSNSGDIDYSLFDNSDNLLKSVSATNTDITSGGIGFLVNDGTAQFDFITR